MGLFDDAMKNAVPGGNLPAPIAVAAGALLLGKLFGGGPSPSLSPSAASPAPQPVPTNAPAGSIIGGLNDLIGKLSTGGAGFAGQFVDRPWREPACFSRASSDRRSARTRRDRRV